MRAQHALVRLEGNTGEIHIGSERELYKYIITIQEHFLLLLSQMSDIV